MIPTVADKASPLAFILQNKIKNENGSLIEFKDHYFLIDPYADMSPEQVVMKPSQIGWSVLAINKALWLAKYKKANVIYTLPSKSVVKDFVQPKVEPIIAQNPLYQEWTGKTDSMALKNIGERFVYFRGSWEQTAAISISAHVLINDEVDRSNSKVLRTYRTRLDDAKRERPELGYVWQFSNPSIPSAGVDERWAKSDQKHWFVKCPYCHHEWYLNFPENIDFERKVYICSKCHKEMDNETRRVGRWVVKNKGAEISGYWINQMMMPWIPAKKIIEDSEGDLQIFHNFTLGLPYISKDQKVDREIITNCISPDLNPRTDVAMGIDNGIKKTVVIGNSYGIFDIYETDSWEKIEADIQRYRARVVIDALPYPNVPQKLAKKYKGKVFVHYFVHDKKETGIVNWGEGDKSEVVQSDRTKIIDLVVSEFQNKDITFNLTLTDLELYIADWAQLYRDIEEGARGIRRPIWKTIEGRRDHFAFATMYWRIALEKTFAGGAVIRTPSKKEIAQEAPIISPDQTVSAIDLRQVQERVIRGNRSWKIR